MATSYICNRMPHSVLNMETLYKKLYVKDADLSHLKIIGARAFVRIYIYIYKKARPRVVGRDGVRLQRDREQTLPHLEPNGASSHICGGVSAFSAFEYFTPLSTPTQGDEVNGCGTCWRSDHQRRTCSHHHS